ncbi:DedA family protein [Candidatus Marsarchaeota archaeon]|nr:DedA family protein [Candidatus Marsarchaeota archaeon]
MLEFALLSILTNAYSTINALIAHYGYFAIFGLMLLEGSSLPVPSEVVLPLAGVLVAQHTLSFIPVYIAALLGSIGGLAIDYYIGYFLGKDVVYKHLKLFHISQEQLDAFDRWFDKNGVASVFFTRFIPVLRTIMSLPAGFAKMPQKKFYAYSILGTGIYDIVLIIFGMKALTTHNAIITLTAIGVFAIVLYAIYRFAMSRMTRQK